MTDPPFDLAGLRAALDEKRQAEGLSWAELSRRIHVAPSTMTTLGTRDVVEMDGVLAMVRWLGRSIESFTDLPPAPPAPPADMLRMDAAKIHAALNAQRLRRGLTWADVARIVSAYGMPTAAPLLARLAKGGRVDVNTVVAICAWLGRPVADFTRVSPR